MLRPPAGHPRRRREKGYQSPSEIADLSTHPSIFTAITDLHLSNVVVDEIKPRIRLIRTEDGILLLGPFSEEPDGQDPVVRIELFGHVQWVKHSRKAPNHHELSRILYWATRMVQHHDDTDFLQGAVGAVSLHQWHSGFPGEESPRVASETDCSRV